MAAVPGAPAPPLAGDCPQAKGPYFRTPERHRKQVWVKALVWDWERVLRRPARLVLGGFPRLDFDSEEAHWSAREFERSDLPNRRLREQLKALGGAWEQRPGECLPAIFPRGKDQQAAYRFLRNERVSMEHILAPHREAMVDRCQLLAGTVLLVQDTTTPNYTGLGQRTSGLGVWGRPLEEPPDEREQESQRWLRELRQGFELGQACPGQRIVVAGDRESDIYELFRERERREQAGEENVELLVRFRRQFRLSSQVGRRARQRRKVETRVSIGPVELQPPEARRQRGEAGVETWLVHVEQIHTRPGEDSLEWFLLSTAGRLSKRWAKRIVGWYEALADRRALPHRFGAMACDGRRFGRDHSAACDSCPDLAIGGAESFDLPDGGVAPRVPCDPEPCSG